MKNWMRESATIQNLLREFLSSRRMQERGFFSNGFIEQMLADHQRKAHNHSHRLWSLLLFELWCRSHLDHQPEAVSP
jgi:asparagine synthase (glutamine-hydrolysing)